MKKPPIPSNEVERLRELQSLKLLEDLPDVDLDLITKLASDICGTKVSLITLIDSKMQIFKSRHGINLENTSREVAFCAHAINAPDKMLIVNDATEDERFKKNPLVTGDPKISFYAGMPLSTIEGVALGTLCVIDSKPKVLSASQIEALKSLAKLVERLFESRRDSLELEKVHNQLELHKNQAEEMVYAIAHDLKNPVDSLQGVFELLLKETDTNLSRNALQYIEYASKSTDKMTELIREILDYAKLSSAKEKNELLDLDSIIENIIDLNLPTIKSKDIEVVYKDLPKIRTSRTLFTIVLRNLIGNAIKYRSTERLLRIEINVQDKTNDWVVSVSDNGKGIRKENQEKIFKPLYKEDEKDISGVGMGLATCEKIVSNLGGQFWTDSELGKGSTFSFNIPK